MVNVNCVAQTQYPQMPMNTHLIRTILVGFIRSEITRTGFHKAVLGLSGGVDSALSCYLAVEALGAENVLVVRMPYRTSSQASFDHAPLVIDDLGISSKTIDISGMADALIEKDPEMNSMRKGNIMARCRMVSLYDQSALENALVVGTSNKTEILLGYSTLFGDSASAINPLGDLYKAQIRALSRTVGVPEVIIAKAPTADLWDGQTDEGELGYTYDEADRLLFLLIDERYTPEECIELGFNGDFVRKIVDRVRRNQFKRMLPPIAKISHRTIGYDFLYLRDWGT